MEGCPAPRSDYGVNLHEVWPGSVSQRGGVAEPLVGSFLLHARVSTIDIVVI